MRKRGHLKGKAVSTKGHIFTPFQQKNPTQPLAPSHFLTTIAISFGALLVAAISFLTANVQLPRWSIVVVASYLIIVTLAVLARPAIHLISLSLNKAGERRTARIFYPHLEELAYELADVLRDDRIDTLSYLLRNISSWSELQGKIPDTSRIMVIREWLDGIRDYLEFSKPKHFRSLAWDLSKLVNQYNRFWFETQRQLESLAADRSLSPQHLRELRQEWNLRREGHMMLLNKWGNIARKINEDVGDRVCIEYYEIIKTLE